MTAYGFDLDGTLTHPGIAQMANDLFNAGHSVFVITGGLSEEWPWRHEDRVSLLAALHVRYTGIIRCISPSLEGIAALKGSACKDHEIAVMLDDMTAFLSGVRKESPSTVLLQVLQ